MDRGPFATSHHGAMPQTAPGSSVIRNELLLGRDGFAEVLQRQLQLAILELRFRLLRRNVAARDDLGVALMLEQVLSLLPRQGYDEAIVGDHAPLLVFLAGCAGLVQVLAAWPPEGGNGVLDLAALERLNVLHAALAERPLADDGRPLVVLEAGRDDFAGAGALAVDQADHGEVRQSAELSAAPLIVDVVSRPADADDGTILDEQVGDLLRGV